MQPRTLVPLETEQEKEKEPQASVPTTLKFDSTEYCRGRRP